MSSEMQRSSTNCWSALDSGAAEAVVDVDGAEADAEGVAWGGVGGVEGEEESYGVGSAGDGDAEAVAGFDVGAVEGEGGRYGHCDEDTVRLTFVSMWLSMSRGCLQYVLYVLG